MDGLLYLIWLSLPIILFILGVLYAVLEFFGSTPESRESKKSYIIFSIARLFLFSSIFAWLIDHFVLIPGLLMSPYAPQVKIIRLSLLPLGFFIAFTFRTIFRLLMPKRGFDRLKVETRGSNPIFTLIALILFVTLVTRKPPEHVGSEQKFVLGDSPTVTRTNSNSQSSAATHPRQEKNQNSYLHRMDEWAESLLVWLGIHSTAEPESNTPYLFLPDFNQEGFLQYRDRAAEVARENGIEPALVQAIIEISSGYNINYMSAQGVGGVMPLSADIAKEYGAKNIFNPEQSLQAGTKYLKELLMKSEGKVRLAIAAFRAGPEAAQTHIQVEENPELARFVERVMTVYEITRARDGSTASESNEKSP